jgi:uncharacterized membrane protein
MIRISFIVAITLMISVSLIAGLFFSFTIAVSPGLKHLSDIVYLKAMKSINKEILNPLFFICFFSPIVLFPLVLYFQQTINSNRWLLISGFVFYFLVILITATINVPLNNQLETFEIQTARQTEISKMRHLFESRWTLWNNIRTDLSAISLIFLLMSKIELSK